MEFWAQTNIKVEYEHYYVSDMGRIYNAKSKKILNGFDGSRGYKYTRLHSDGQRETISIHRLVALTFIDNPEKKPQVNHIDGNTLNNCVDNLEWVTVKENAQHALQNGLRSNKIGQLLLNRDTIQELLNEAYSNKKIAEIFECERQTIEGFIKRNKLVKNKTRKLSPPQVKELFELFSDGHPLITLKDRFGVSNQTLRNAIVETYGLEKFEEASINPKHKLHKNLRECIQQVKSDRDHGLSYKKLGVKYGVNEKTVKSNLKHFYGE